MSISPEEIDIKNGVLGPAVRDRLIGYARQLMSDRLRQKHDPESAVQSALASAAGPQNADLWDLPADDLFRILQYRTWNKVRERVARLMTDGRDIRREAGSVDDNPPTAAGDPDPTVTAEWNDLWEWIERRLAEESPDYAGLPGMYREGLTTAEMADRLGVSIRTVSRKVLDMAELLRGQLDPPAAPGAG